MGGPAPGDRWRPRARALLGVAFVLFGVEAPGPSLGVRAVGVVVVGLAGVVAFSLPLGDLRSEVNNFE